MHSLFNDQQLNEIDLYLQENLSEKRYKHIIRVMEMAIYLYEYCNRQKDIDNKFSFSKRDVMLAALLHDVTKEEREEFHLQYLNDEDLKYLNKENYKVWHGFSAANFIQEKFSIDNKLIIEAVRYHTTGGGMGDLGKIVYAADYIEPGRPKDSSSMLQLIYNNDLNYLCLKIAEDSNTYLKSIDKEINPLTIEFMESLKIK